MESTIGLKYAVEQIAGEGLRISYRVTNYSDQTIFLTTPLVQIDSEAITPASAKSYAYLDPEGILHITKRLWPIPDEVDIYQPEVPRLTEVRPGAAFEEQFSCAVPVEVQYPYRFAGEEEPEAPETLTGEAYGVAFSIGHLIEGEGEGGFSRPIKVKAETEAGDEGGSEGGLVVGYALAAACQKLLQGAVVAMRVGVKDVNR